MAKKKITKKSRISVVKKRWYSLKAPAVFNNVEIGETTAVEPEKLPGRSVKVNLSLLMRKPKAQNVEVTFRIAEVKGSEAITEFEKIEIVAPFIKRLVKRAKSRIDDSFVCETKDGIKVRLKPIVLLRGKVQRGTQTDIQSKVRESLTNSTKELTLNQLLDKVLVGELSKALKGELKNIYTIIFSYGEKGLPLLSPKGWL